MGKRIQYTGTTEEKQLSRAFHTSFETKRQKQDEKGRNTSSSAAVSLYDPSREKGIAERPQAFRYPEILNNDSLKDAQSNAEGIQNRFAQRWLLARTLIRRCAPPSPDWGKAFVLS